MRFLFLKRIVLGITLALAGCNMPLTMSGPDSVEQTRTVQAAEVLVKTAEADATQLVHLEKPAPTVEAPDKAPVTTGTPIPEASTAPLKVTLQQVKEESQAPPVILDIDIPVFAQPDGSAVDGLNQDVQDLVERLRQEVHTAAAQITPMPDMMFGPNSLYIRYEVMYNEAGLVSIYFPLSTYSQGAAHPFPFSESITYDVNQKRRIQLSDLFQPGDDYLALLSKLSIEDLKRQGRLEWEDGAQPVAENFKSWNITPQGLAITFDPYQVSSYAAGYQKVVLPWESLSVVLNPGYRFEP